MTVLVVVGTRTHHESVFIDEVFDARGGLATTDQLLAVMSRKALAGHVKVGAIVRVWRGVYSLAMPDTLGRLDALDRVTGRHVVACMNTAAELHGFDAYPDRCIHILDPGVRMRPVDGLMVHQRLGAPLQRVRGRLTTTPAWTATELARLRSRPRALAVLDAAVHSGACTAADLGASVCEQKGRRGIVAVRDLLAHVDGRAESVMESEARLVMIDGGLPAPVLQFEVVDRQGQLWRIDFAWPAAKLAAEYDSIEWHSSREGMLRDKMRIARLQECGWTIIPITVDDVRRDPIGLVARIRHHLYTARQAG